MFQQATYIGLGLVALWLYARFPNRRPETLMRAVARVMVAFGVFMTLPLEAAAYKSAFTGPTAGLFFIFGVAMPLLCWVMLSWLWLLARVIHDYGPDLPSGGHPATSGA